MVILRSAKIEKYAHQKEIIKTLFEVPNFVTRWNVVLNVYLFLSYFLYHFL
jgi:hypothetical protein